MRKYCKGAGLDINFYSDHYAGTNRGMGIYSSREITDSHISNRTRFNFILGMYHIIYNNSELGRGDGLWNGEF